MTGLGLGLLLGSGLFLLWWSSWTPAPTSPRPLRRNGAAEQLRDDLTQAGMATVGVRALLALCAATGAGVSVVAWVVSSSPPIAGCFGVIAAWGPLALVRMRARRRRTLVRDLWPEAVDHLTSGIRAGLSLPEALTQLGQRGPVELRPAFVAFAADYRATGAFSPSLDLLKDRLADPVADRIIEALRLTRDVGGSDLGRLLRTLSGFLREDARTRAELETRQGWTVSSARLAVAAPWIVLALLSSRPEAVAAYNGPTGVLVLTAGGAVTALAYRVMMRIGRLPAEERVLR